jgi:hypothetical protein
MLNLYIVGHYIDLAEATCPVALFDTQGMAYEHELLRFQSWILNRGETPFGLLPEKKIARPNDMIGR